MRYAGRDEQDVARLDPRKLPADLVFQRAFEDVDDLLAWVRVQGSGLSGQDLDDRLDRLVSGDAEVVPLQIDAPGRRLLRWRRLQFEDGYGDQRRRGDDLSRFHLNPHPGC